MKKLLNYIGRYYRELFTYWINSVKNQIIQHRFIKARNEAQQLANNNRRKYWVIRGKGFSYTILNSSDIHHYKNIGIFKQKINFLHLDKISDYIATPQ